MNQFSKYSLQTHQKFIQRFFSTNIKRSEVLFLFHSTGSGKTCSAVTVSEKYITYLRMRPKLNGNVYIFSNKSAEENFIKEITGRCGNVANGISLTEDNRYISQEELRKIDRFRIEGDLKTYRKMRRELIYSRLNDAGYRFYTFQTLGRDSIFRKIKNFNNSLIIIDEAHTLLNDNKFVQAFDALKSKSKNFKVLLLSATPMINEPENIVNFINIMYENKIDRSEIFESESNKIKKGGLKVIADKFKGKLSYVYSIDPRYYPKRIDVGRIPKGLLKYTKLIRVPMSKIQFDTYKKYWNGYHVKPGLRNIIDFTLPGGIYNLAKNIRKMPVNYRKKLGIEIYGSEPRITGNFLKLPTLSKYSPKFAKCMEDIIKTVEGHTLIFSHYVYNSGIKLFGEIMRINGFVEYGSSPTRSSRHYLTHVPYHKWKGKGEFIPAKYVVFYNKLSIEERNNILKLFRSKDNRDGRHIKYILGSQLIKESVDLNRIRHVRLLGYQDNFSRVEQIIGRAIRFQSHKDVDKTCFIHKYISSLPEPIKDEEILEITRKYYPDLKNVGKWSAGELEYYKDERNHVVIKKIERTLKMISLDCKLNKNFFTSDLDFTKECDYMKCEYKCVFDNYDFEKIYNIKNDMIYKMIYSPMETYNLINEIKELFHKNIIISSKGLHKLLDRYVDDHEFIDIAAKLMVENKIPIATKYGHSGFLQFINGNYIYHPKGKFVDPSLPMNIRGVGFKHIPKISRNVEEEMLDMILSGRKGDLADIYRKTKAEIKDTKNYIKIKKILNNTKIKVKIKILEYAIKIYRRSVDSNNPAIPQHVFHILKFFRYHLIDGNVKHRLMYNKNFDQYFDQDKSSITDPTKNFVGHILDISPKIINQSDIFERKQFREILDIYTNLPENDFMIGFVVKESGELILKLRRTQKLGKIHDKRKIKKGFKCIQINNKKEIQEIYARLTDQNMSEGVLSDLKISDFCNLINKELRRKQHENTKIRWLYDYYE